MTDVVIISIVQAAATLGGIILTGVVKKNISKIHKQINGKMDQLIDFNRKEAKQEGIDEANENKISTT